MIQHLSLGKQTVKKDNTLNYNIQRVNIIRTYMYYILFKHTIVIIPTMHFLRVVL